MSCEKFAFRNSLDYQKLLKKIGLMFIFHSKNQVRYAYKRYS